MALIQQILAFILSLVMSISSLLGIPVGKINYDDFELVWSDEFEGSALDSKKWTTSGTNTSVRRGGYWNGELCEVKDGNLVIYSKYLENGVNKGDPAGWYTTMVETRNLFEQTNGYFEVRCILPKGLGQWSAFWMMNDDGMSNPYPDGSYGGEIDIFEAPFYGYSDSDRVMGAVHWGGYGDAHKSLAVYYTYQPNHPYDNYNTYGIEWNEDEYNFFVNGKKTSVVSKDKAIPSKVPMYMILSTEIAGENGVPSKYWAEGTADDNGKDFVGEFKIDYVRVYQYK